MSNKADFRSYIFTRKKDLCSGCGTCSQICRHDALRMKSDSEGFLYPEIDSDKCVSCGLCDLICPVTGSQTENKGESQHCYIATSNKREFYEDSASIGICSMLSGYVVDHGGIVYGAFLDESSWAVYHIPVEKKSDINKIRNSKYLQSSTGNTFTQVKEKLGQDHMVLYIGTPCQIAGLKSFLHKDFPNLYTVDLICHGVFSPKLMPLEIGYWENLLGGKISNFRFRSKRVYKNVNGGMVNFDLTRKGNSRHIERFAASSPSYRCYAYAGDGKMYNHRISCYSCNFRSYKRYGDLTVGDPWFISNKVICSDVLTSNNPVRSLYSVNTVKGEELISKIRENLVEEELKLEVAFTQPALQKAKKEIPIEREKLYSLLDSQDYGSLVENLLKCNLIDAHKQFARQYIKVQLKKIVKKLFLI